MSTIQYQRNRLNEAFECLVESEQDDGPTQRNCMYTIMVCCNELRLDLRDFLRDKFMGSVGTHNPLPAYPEKIPLQAVNRSYTCRDCGMTFLTKQARAGHMAHCKQKGGGHEKL